MRASLLTLLLLASALASGQPVIGPEQLLGDASPAPMDTTTMYGSPDLDTDGDETLMVWTVRSSLYAQRLDRHGRAVAEMPTLLVYGTSQVRPIESYPRVLYTGGLYSIFYRRLSEERKWETWVMRVTRELEIVDARVFSSDLAYNIVRSGDEILLVMKDTVYRLRDDLSVIGTIPLTQGFVGRFAPSPHGTLLLSGSGPAITARMLDDSVSVRFVPTDSLYALRGVWTGTQFLVVWNRCFAGSCETALVTLDEQLRITYGPVKLDSIACSSCDLDIAVFGTDEAFVTWGSDGKVRGVRVRKGWTDGRQPSDFGSTTTTFVTAQGLMLIVDRKLNVRAFVPAALNGSPMALPVLAAPRAAVEESIVAVAGSANEVAVVRRRGETYIASILDAEGRTLREATLPSGGSVTLAHDGRDFYAVAGSRFQKLATGAPVVNLPFVPDGALVWTGSGFVTLQSHYPDHAGQTQYRTRMLRLTPTGEVELMPCPNWEFPSTAAAAPVVVRAGSETVIVVGKHLARLRDGCPAGPPTPVENLPYTWRVAWQNGRWAWVSTVMGSNLDLWLADDPASSPSRHSLADGLSGVYESNFDIAPLSGHWLVAYNDGSLRAVLADFAGRRLSTSVISPTTNGRPFLVPMPAGRVLAIYQRQVPEPPYLGVTRVMAAPLTLEAPSRRRAVRP